MTSEYDQWQSVAVRPPSDEAVIHDGFFYHYGASHATDTSPFQTNSYNFDAGFYKGDFTYTDPLTGKPATGTPERYGRQRIAAFLGSRLLAGSTVLDIGSGTADIARALPTECRGDTNLVFTDISGPWTKLGEASLLVEGWKKLRDQPPYASTLNIQCDLNASDWPFRSAVFDYIVSNMALHHIDGDRKQEMAEKIHDSLKPGGSLVITDVFDYKRERTVLTIAGEKGPAECSGSPEPIQAMVQRLERLGFIVAGENIPREAEEDYFSAEDMQAAVDDLSYMLPINRAVWYLTARKLAE